MAVRDREGFGLLIAGDPVLEFSAHPYRPEDLTQEEARSTRRISSGKTSPA
jgi:hypothetical protein